MADEIHAGATADLKGRVQIRALDDGRFQVTDLGSKNGTYVDGVRVASRDDVRMGPLATKAQQRDIEAGIVWVNCYEHGDMTQPWGGYKQSGQGRDKCFETMLAHTQTKSIWINLGS